MSWIQKLSDTYDNCQASIGYADQQDQRPLLPICHITTQAQIEITLDGTGNFQRAKLITDKADSTTIIPSTESSAGRAGSKPENHPLCDKLQYVAGDFQKYGGIVTSGFSKDPQEPYRKYIETLTNWSNSLFTHSKLIAILNYVKKKSVITDLVDSKILYVGNDSRLSKKEDVKREKNVKDIFSVVDPQQNAFVRWVVYTSDDLESRVWRDKALWKCWINYYLSGKTEKSLCFVTGENQVITNNHPKYIRREGDGAKIISANDTSGFTFRGRFLTDQQACGVGLDASHKSHYALSWLISRQGYRKGDLAIVAWATSGATVPQPTDDLFTILGINDLPTDEASPALTAQNVALQLKKKISGYGNELGNTTDVVVMSVDSASPGRLAITYYRELSGSDFLQRIDDWHTSCAWIHHYRSIDISGNEDGKTKKKYIPFIGAPAPNDIAEAAYGSRIDDKLRKTTIVRILPCIIDGLQIPRDLVESTLRRASNRIALEDWEWNKTLSIACALFRKYYRKGNYKMTLEENRTSRDYLYGRLLAIADRLEEVALYKSKEKRATNSARYMQQFSQHPFRTWNQIHSSLTPYIIRLDGATYFKKLMAEVSSKFDPEEFITDKPLTGEYLLGYYCQKQKLLDKTKDDESIEEAKQD